MYSDPKHTPPPPDGTDDNIDYDSIAHQEGNLKEGVSSIPHEEGKLEQGIKATPKVDKRKFNGRKKGTKNLKTIAKELVATDDFYKIARRKTGGLKDVYEMLFAKAVAEKDLTAAKIIMDKVMPNAQIEKDGAIKDLGIVINIGDMKAVEVKEIEGEVLSGEVIDADS